MLSRFHSRAAVGCNLLKCIKQYQIPATTMADRAFPFEKFPERDHVNFPRLEIPKSSPPVRMGFIPDSWFQAFYPKTGVSGPYMLMIGVSTYLLSKEILVFDAEMYNGLTFIGAIVLLHKKFGPKISDSLKKSTDDWIAQLDRDQMQEEEKVKDMIAENEKLVKQYQNTLEMLPVAKRENVHLQMEAAYRERLSEVHDQVKRMLDFHLERKQVERRIAQKNIGDWVIRNVLSSITNEQKKSILAQCISDLKTISVTAQRS